jgi:hypothetical protein
MSSEKIGILFTIIITGIFLLLSYFISAYFYIISIPLVLFFIYALIETIFPALHKSLFIKKHKSLISNNGVNETYFRGGRTRVLKERFYTKDGERHGKYESFYLDGLTVNITANYNYSKLHGESKTWSIATPFGGGCYRYIENYENGELRNRKVYLTGVSSPLVDPEKKLKELAKEVSFEPGNSEKGYIEEDIRGNSLK